MDERDALLADQPYTEDEWHEATIADLRTEVERLRDSLTDLVDYADRHRLSYEDHEHDCYQEWSLLRDEARNLLHGARR